MAVSDIHAQSIILSEPSSELLAGWGKKILGGLNLVQTTQISRTNRGYELLVNDQKVRIELSRNQQTEALEKISNAQPVVMGERLDLIKDRLSLSITQLAELFGVTRKTIYDWYEGTEPRPKAASRMEMLIDVLNQTSPETDLSRLKAVWSIPVSGASFRKVFNDDNMDAETFQNALVEKLHELSIRMVATASPMRKTISKFGEAQLAEFDRRTEQS